MAGMNVQINAERGLKWTEIFGACGNALEHAASSWVCRPSALPPSCAVNNKTAATVRYPVAAALLEMMRMRCVVHAPHYRYIPEKQCSEQVKVVGHFGADAAALTG